MNARRNSKWQAIATAKLNHQLSVENARQAGAALKKHIKPKKTSPKKKAVKKPKKAAKKAAKKPKKAAKKPKKATKKSTKKK